MKLFKYYYYYMLLIRKVVKRIMMILMCANQYKYRIDLFTYFLRRQPNSSLKLGFAYIGPNEDSVFNLHLYRVAYLKCYNS